MKKKMHVLLDNIESPKEYTGAYSVMSELFELTIAVSVIKEIQVSQHIHDLLVQFANGQSKVYILHVKRLWNIPVIVNSSFPNDIWEIHFDSYIERKQIKEVV